MTAGKARRVSMPRCDANFDIVAMVGSYGTLPALLEIVPWLPPDFPVPIVVIQHATSVSLTPQIVAHRYRALDARFAEQGDKLDAGTIYFATPGRHLVVSPDYTCQYYDGPKVRYSRPAGDPCFRSAAIAYGDRTLGVVLSGFLTDGTDGSRAIRAVGGVVMAQEPSSASASSMPQSVIDAGLAHFVLPPYQLGAALVSLVSVAGVPSLFGLGHRLAA